VFVIEKMTIPDQRILKIELNEKHWAIPVENSASA
jgi:hypothetical protein